jgi:phosphatidylglycerol lysyltransferase
MPQTRSTSGKVQRTVVVDFIAYAVALGGVLIIASTLPTGHFFGRLHVSFDLIGPTINLLLGLGLLYLSVHIRRRKQTAWVLSVAILSLLVLLGVEHMAIGRTPMHHAGVSHFLIQHVLIDVIIPVLILIGLAIYRDQFTVKSDIRSFALSMRIVVMVFAAAFIYGVVGFLLMDNHDFHKEIGLGEAMHHTVDQFGLTTTSNLTPYTGRAKAFLDSLSVISTAAVAYALISLFQPIRMRFTDQASNREKAHDLLDRYPASSEDFFKLWPRDKLYFFNESESAGLAYHVNLGVALVVGDPFGDRVGFDGLIDSFDELCVTNDWTPAFIHTEHKYNELYKKHDLSLQKIGEEAILDLAVFRAETVRNKYFRQIRNKFVKQGYTTEILMPPHNDSIIKRLNHVSAEWLSQPGREERGFMMGAYSAQYMNACPVMVLRDAAGTIQGFINQILSFDKEEANFDLLRHSKESLGNSNDFLMMNFIEYLHNQGFKRLNMGLCPLAGLASHDEERSVVDNALRFVYANGDRFYSFSGLHRFKAKYDPIWDGRYIAYRGGIANFTRALNALNRAMRVHSSRRR